MPSTTPSSELEGHLRDREREYDVTRYLRHVPDDALGQRQADIEHNLWEANGRGEVIRVSDQRRRLFLFDRLVDLQREQQYRGQRAGLSFDEREIIRRASRDYTPPRFDVGLECAIGLVRYGKREHIEDALLYGRFRLSPAAAYNDNSLNAAQIDDELRHHSVTPNEQLKFTVYGSATLGEPAAPIQMQPLQLFRYMLLNNFYVLCCSRRFDPRMFHDFEADAAIIIRDEHAFLQRMACAMTSATPNFADVGYYDPHTVSRGDLVPGFSKHFRYAYQNEFRLLWTPGGADKLEPMFVEIGDMRDIAEVIRTGPSES